MLLGAVGGPRVRCARLCSEAGTRAAAPAQGDGPLRQPASGAVLRRAGRLFVAEARGGGRSRHPDRRELTGGVYFGEPRGIFTEGKASGSGSTPSATARGEIARVARSAFGLARQRSNRVCSMEKANVMEFGRAVAAGRHRGARCRVYPDVELSHMYADAGAMQLTRWPKQFDVIVTENLFGDLLSDEAAVLTGSLGMLPSASLGRPMRRAVGGALRGRFMAPRRTSPATATPTRAGSILSRRWLLRYSLRPRSGSDRRSRIAVTAIALVLERGLPRSLDRAQGRLRERQGGDGKPQLGRSERAHAGLCLDLCRHRARQFD